MSDPIELVAVEGDRTSWLPLLLEADDNEVVVRSYMNEGTLLAIREAGHDVGLALLLEDGDEVEIKNFAVVAERRGEGIGRRALAAIADRSRAAGTTSLLIGTADAAPETILFYERAGFHVFGAKAGFFDDYPDPVWVDGVLAHDMVMLRMDLSRLATRG